jgi:serine/threonine protein kinase
MKDETLKIDDTTEGLEEIHKIGLIHRDMKLENVVYCN